MSLTGIFQSSRLLLSASLPAGRLQPAAPVTTTLLSLAPSAQADVNWLGPPQSGLNAYSGELLLETARQRVGSESKEPHRASLALRQFFDLINRRGYICRSISLNGYRVT
jgi:hypothetical protein